eukprot:EG_transcript_4188
MSTCKPEYKPLLQQHQPPSAAASDSLTLSVALGVVLGVAFLLAIAACLALRGKRNNRAAPKDPSQPYCVIFTDIQASTTLWATVPNDMAPALDAHHCLIRKLIRKFNLYEVKTIGDSFMCVTRNALPALRFALALQETFHEYDWGTRAIDEAYDLLVPESPKMPECWNGLRVRVGIHFGHGEIKRDPVSRGYDYYGTVVNTAARIESVCHGGQVCLSEAAYHAVRRLVAGVTWIDLGPHALRGLGEPVYLFQALPIGPLANRRFPPLRIDRVDARGEALEDDGPPGPHVDGRRTTQYRPKNHSIVPSTTDSLQNEKWAEFHPLVVKGETTVDELRRHYAILQVGLTTLLASQLRQMKQQILEHLCERLHTTNHGAEGSQLLHTLHGLIGRLLPATIAQQGARRGSVHSKVSSASPSPRHLAPTRAPSLRSRNTRQDSPAGMYIVNLPPQVSEEDVGSLPQ